MQLGSCSGFWAHLLLLLLLPLLPLSLSPMLLLLLWPQTSGASRMVFGHGLVSDSGVDRA